MLVANAKLSERLPLLRRGKPIFGCAHVAKQGLAPPLQAAVKQSKHVQATPLPSSGISHAPFAHVPTYSEIEGGVNGKAPPGVRIVLVLAIRFSSVVSYFDTTIPTGGPSGSKLFEPENIEDPPSH